VTADRREQQHAVSALLETIGAQATRLEGLRAVGARGGALSGAEEELADLRERLARITSRRFRSLAP
jgi:hypothetical protein